MHKASVIRISLIVFILSGFQFEMFPQIPDGYEKGLDYINKSDIKNSITFLASDELKGRAAGTDENLEAARFIAKKFAEFGLQPYSENKFYHNVIDNEDDENKLPVSFKENVKPDFYDKYFQRFYLTDSKINEDNSRLNLTTRNENYSKSFHYKIKKDFTVSYKSSRGIALDAPIVFIGYGIDKGEENYNDYLDANDKEIDVKDKLVLIVDGFPRENDFNSDFTKSKNILLKSVRKKAEVAMEKGALAVLVAQSPIKQNPPFLVKFEKFASAFLKSEFGLPELKTKETIPIIYVSNDIVEDLFKGSKQSLSDLLVKIDKNIKPKSFTFNDSKVKIELNFNVDLIPTQNVIGYLEGTDPVLKNEFVVFGAHYDHVGLGYYGAMDKKILDKFTMGLMITLPVLPD